MKKIIFLVCLMIFLLSVSMVFGIKSNPENTSDNLIIPNKKENKLSEEEISQMTNRVEEIRDMDKTNLTFKERNELKKELKGIKENVKKDTGPIYIGTGALILIIILIIILL